MGFRQSCREFPQTRSSLRGCCDFPLEDPLGASIPDPDASGEARMLFLGVDPSGRLLVTVYTMRGRVTRIISSRKASRAERRKYEAIP
jgi:uncharacterized DUF497 family protein